MAFLYLVRHTAVAQHWSGRCYGRSDVPLSTQGRAAARALAPALRQLGVRRLYASPLRRARYLAGLVAREDASLDLVIDPRLMECDFGAWEGCSWETIYADSGDAMMGLLQAPQSFQPGGSGESTFAMRDRVMAWLDEVLRRDDGPVLAVTHGGPIAALRGTLSGAPVAEWPSLVPRHGEIAGIEIPSPGERNSAA